MPHERRAVPVRAILPPGGHRRGALVSALGLLLAVLLAGCGPGGTAASTARGDALAVAAMPGLGRVLVDGAGHTLYLYVPDRQGGRSRCSGNCARQWPPLIAAPHARLGPGVRRSLVGETRRPGGGEQVTYAGWPLYTWRNDLAPGQATGEGQGMGLWWA
ncbi:MAG: COG4315 family predicted lipoprotein, partial [Acidimicrobiales bacterium]